MANELPDHAELERVFQTEPKRILDRLGDGFKKERARENLDIAYGYVKELREDQKKADI